MAGKTSNRGSDTMCIAMMLMKVYTSAYNLRTAHLLRRHHVSNRRLGVVQVVAAVWAVAEVV